MSSSSVHLLHTLHIQDDGRPSAGRPSPPMFLQTTSNRIVVTSFKGGTTVLKQNSKDGVLSYVEETTLEVGEGWGTTCHEDLLAVANKDGVVRLWDLNISEVIKEFHGHKGAIKRVLLPDKSTLISSDDVGVIRIWDLTMGNCKQILTGHTEDVNCLDSHSGELISAAEKTVRVWDMASGECLHILNGHDTIVGILGFKQDHTLVVSGETGGLLKVWRLSDGECIAECVGHTKIATNLADKNGHLVTSAADGSIREWSWDNGRLIRVIEAHTDGDNKAIRAMTFFDDGKLMVSAGMDGKVKVWDFENGRCLRELDAGDHRNVWIGQKLDEDHFVGTMVTADDRTVLKIFNIRS